MENYPQKSEFSKLSNYVETLKFDIQKKVDENALRVENIKEEVNNQFLSNIRNEWDLKFENFNDIIENLGKDLTLQMEGQEQIFNDTLAIQSEAINKSQDELLEIRSIISNLNTKIFEVQNLSNLVDTKHDTGSKTSSIGKIEKDKDFEVQDPINDSLRKFKVSPMQVDEDEICQVNENIDEINIEDEEKEIEDSSIFGLTPTPKPLCNGIMSRTQKMCLNEKNGKSSTNSSVVEKPENIQNTPHLNKQEEQKFEDEKSNHSEENLQNIALFQIDKISENGNVEQDNNTFKVNEGHDHI